MRLGILGGTFDPVHAGHIAMARSAAAAARLDRVLLVPCARPPHKERPDLTDGYHRFGMLALVVAEEPALSASPIELQRGGISYTVDTLRELRQRHSGADLCLIIGSDSFAELADWKAYEEILGSAAILVVPRPVKEAAPRRPAPGLPLLGSAAEGIRSGLGNRLPYAALVATDPVDISST